MQEVKCEKKIKLLKCQIKTIKQPKQKKMKSNFKLCKWIVLKMIHPKNQELKCNGGSQKKSNGEWVEVNYETNSFYIVNHECDPLLSWMWPIFFK